MEVPLRPLNCVHKILTDQHNIVHVSERHLIVLCAIYIIRHSYSHTRVRLCGSIVQLLQDSRKFDLKAAPELFSKHRSILIIICIPSLDPNTEPVMVYIFFTTLGGQEAS